MDSKPRASGAGPSDARDEESEISEEERSPEFEEEERRAALRAILGLFARGASDAVGVFFAKHRALLESSAHVAAAVGDIDVLSALIERDASVAKEEVGTGLQPLFFAAVSRYGDGAIEAVEKSEGEEGRKAGEAEALLGEETDVPSAEDRVRTARAACVRLLLRHGADPARAVPNEESPGGGITPLSAAAGMSGDAHVCETLLECGANPNDGVSLFLALVAGHDACVERLLRHGADLNARESRFGLAPLHWMLDVRYVPRAVAHALELGADPNLATGDLGETALHVAVRRRRVDAVDGLLDAGADIEARTTGGMTAYRHARRRGFADVAERLVDRGADTSLTVSDEIAVALVAGDLERARSLAAVHSDALVTGVPEEDRVLADLAALGRIEEIRFLLDAGMPIDARGLDRGTPLHQAAWFGQDAVAEFLIDAGAPLDVRGDDHDSTPLGWAAHGSRHSDSAESAADRYARIVKLLLRAGAALPGPEDPWDRVRLESSAPGVLAVLAEHGWPA